MITDEQIQKCKADFGRFLEDFIERKGYTLYQVCKYSGLSLEQLKFIFSGGRAYTVDTLIKLAYVLDLESEIKQNVKEDETIAVEKKESSMFKLLQKIEDQF